ncbi:MAG: nitrogen regulation protein NR(I) [Candidatus Thiodiazotropha endolucinida]
MDRSCRVWVIDDDRSIRWVLQKTLEKADMDVTCFESADRVMNYLDKEQPDVVVSDIRMPGMDGLELLELLHTRYPDMPVIIMTAHSDLESAVSAYHGGAFEYLPKPFDVDEAVQQIRRACRQQISEDEKPTQDNLDQEKVIIGEAPAMQEVFRAIGRLARSNITVLINGESGTGKELVAHALHRHSTRSTGPFIALNMAAIPKDLMESELFGHERGAFTGAQTRRTGRFEQADCGTLFLDEIGDMPAELQTRLLRVLADGEFYRVGGHEPVKVDVRIIAATHQHLEGLVKLGSFREDLFHRLNVIRIHIPSLRQRREDIPLLMKHFLKSAAEELAVETKLLLPETEAYLSQLEWRGNVRQLENTARWLTVMASGQEIHVDDLPSELKESRTRSVTAILNEWAQILAFKCRWPVAPMQGLLTTLLPVNCLSFISLILHVYGTEDLGFCTA